jgi:plastocyanin
MRRLWVPAVVAGVAGLIAAAPHRPAVIHSVVVSNLAFQPATVTAHVGDKVMWNNRDIFLHSATGSAKGFDVTLKPNATVGVVLKRAGVFDYICRYHPGMKGRIVVEN